MEEYSFLLENLPGEIWRDIIDYEELYQISNFGRVKRLCTTLLNKSNRWGKSMVIRRKERIHKYHINKAGRPRVELSKNGVQKIFSVSRLVAAVFLPNPLKLPLVCHKDDNPLNNKVENLFWGTQMDNIKDKVSKNRQAKGETNAQSYLKENQVLEIRGKFDSGDYRICDLAIEYSTTDVNISHIVKRKNWRHI